MSLKKYFGSLIINVDERITLGHGDLTTLKERMTQQQSKHNERVEFGVMLFADSKDKLNEMERQFQAVTNPKDEYAGLNEHQIWAREWAKNHPDLLTPIEEVESPVPGVSIEYIIERQASPIYERWAMLSIHPEKRVGVPQSLIDEARLAWEQYAPEIAHYLPQWVD